MWVRLKEVKINSKALQGECLLLRISGDFELSEFELSGQTVVHFPECVQLIEEIRFNRNLFSPDGHDNTTLYHIRYEETSKLLKQSRIEPPQK